MKKLFLALLAMATALAITPAALATNLGLQLSSGASTVTICDNGGAFTGCSPTGTDSNVAVGSVTYIGGVGTSPWTANISSGVSGTPTLDISTYDSATTTTGAAPLTLLLTETGLTSPLGTISGLIDIGGTSTYTGTIVSTEAFLSTNDTAFCDVVSATCLALTSLGTGTGGNPAFSVAGTAATGGGPYSLTLLATINPGANIDTTSFDDSLVTAATPEPSSLLLLGTGLLGLAFVAFRKAKASGAVLGM